MPTFSSSPGLTVSVLLKQPQFIARALTDLTAGRFVADKILRRGSAQQVQGGVMRYQQAESIYPAGPAEEIAENASWPRTSWTEALLTALVKQYGLEIPISNLSLRRNQMDQVERGLVKLGNQIVKFVDTQAMAMLVADANVQTFAASGDWTTAATDIFADLARAIQQIDAQDQGYAADTIVVNFAQYQDLLSDKDIRDAMPRETTQSTIQTGRLDSTAGLNILRTNQLAAGTVFVLQAGMVGTIADEQPDAAEGWVSRTPGAGLAPIYAKVYEEDPRKGKVVAAGRWPAMAVIEPKAAVKITAA
jgi:hypothetical protein